jgi:hypothetical protein
LVGGYIVRNNYVYLVSLIAFSLVSAYVLSRIVTDARLDDLLPKLKISRSSHNSIWLNIKDNDSAVWITVVDDSNGLTYRGIIDKIESFERKPIIILARYQIMDEDGDALDDNYTNPQAKLVLDMAEYKVFELYYGINSKKIAVTKAIIEKEEALQLSKTSK